jgi:hypothetical protein
MTTLETVSIGVGSALIASVIFLAAIRTFLVPRIDISNQMAHNLNTADVEAYRFKIVNQSRWTEAVRFHCDLVTMKQIAADGNQIKGGRRYLIGRRKTVEILPFKFERETLDFRPREMVSLKPLRRDDEKVEYAFRLTTTDCEKIEIALQDPSMHIRLRVYAEHPWSGRGRTFTKTYGVRASAICGDYVLGYEMTINHDQELEDALRLRRNSQKIPIEERGDLTTREGAHGTERV